MTVSRLRSDALAERQRDLQAELQKKAEEARKKLAGSTGRGQVRRQLIPFMVNESRLDRLIQPVFSCPEVRSGAGFCQTVIGHGGQRVFKRMCG